MYQATSQESQIIRNIFKFLKTNLIAGSRIRLRPLWWPNPGLKTQNMMLQYYWLTRFKLNPCKEIIISHLCFYTNRYQSVHFNSRLVVWNQKRANSADVKIIMLLHALFCLPLTFVKGLLTTAPDNVIHFAILQPWGLISLSGILFYWSRESSSKNRFNRPFFFFGMQKMQNICPNVAFKQCFEFVTYGNSNIPMRIAIWYIVQL